MIEQDPGPRTRFLAALCEVEHSIDDNLARAKAIKLRINVIRSHYAKGVPLSRIVTEEERPLIVELISQNTAELNFAGSRLRWAEAIALQAEGLTIAEIARQFGVSRQRVSALLNQPPKSTMLQEASHDRP